MELKKILLIEIMCHAKGAPKPLNSPTSKQRPQAQGEPIDKGSYADLENLIRRGEG